MLGERALQRAELPARAGQSLNRNERVAVGLDGQHQTRANRLAVERDRAGAADAVLAADVGTGQSRLVADEVRQQRARLNLARR